ncbi:hypothetical protein P8452_57440 [Trifolium repens]|nr:hypothetical protein P8452_42408 [Trifolium repens]WJX63433.1 hypothetical protein P8452_48320 [Trifolium repens]WJX73687.1 hypothetical protein P8452_57440 [Trifolium repens]
MAACDTFRLGVVEQLQTHARRLEGYEKDPAALIKLVVCRWYQRWHTRRHTPYRLETSVNPVSCVYEANCPEWIIAMEAVI